MSNNKEAGNRNRLKPLRILAISSAGGHWVQLQRLRSAWDGCHVAYVTSKAEYEPDVMEDARRREQRPPRFYKIIEANRWKKADLIRQCAQILAILIRERPHVIVTTGAAPGFFALLLGKILRSRTIWIDSIANAEEMSLSGQKAKSFADLWLTQWEHLSGGSGGGASPDRDKPDYKGAVL